MPNFNTHRAVAIRLADQAPGFITNGWNFYRSRTRAYAKQLERAILAVKTKADFKRFADQTLDNIIRDYHVSMRKVSSEFDDITCFSAYMTGACGPDFWTLPTTSRGGVVPDFAGIHFDMGHYNRTHCQFQAALKRWSKANQWGELQNQVEQSYFFGMLTHIGADLILHELVNSYAGAYNLLDKVFENEHGYLPANIWNTHNKVEHYWDSYIRYRYYSGIGPIFGKRDEKDAILAAQGFPLVEDLIIKVTQNEACEVKAAFSAWLAKDKIKFKIERCQMFPNVFCDRILKKQVAADVKAEERKNKWVKPFVYDVVVDKEVGAYPEDLLFKGAIDEADTRQMTKYAMYKAHDECGKLRFFSTELNESADNCGNNYLTYYTCPNLVNVRLYANDAFVHLEALIEFINRAEEVGKRFFRDFKAAIAISKAGNKGEEQLGIITKCWNLDTGLGLEIESIESEADQEVITRIHFKHITDELNTTINYSRDETYIKGKASLNYSNPDEKPVFDTYEQKPVGVVTDIEESDAKKYIRSLKIKGPIQKATKVGIENFFEDAVVKRKTPKLVKTEKAGVAQNQAQVLDIKNRLSLMFSTSVIKFGEQVDDVCFYMMGDKRKKISEAIPYEDHQASNWLKGKKMSGLDWLYGNDPVYLDYMLASSGKAGERQHCDGNRYHFDSYVLLNLERDKEQKRELVKGKWNNVVEYSAHKDHYSRNYAVCTGRKHVLKPSGSGNFDPLTKYQFYENVSPTEQIFISLYTLVRDKDGVYDAVSKEPVSREALKELKKISCLGFMKIILFYLIDDNGAVQVDECLIDGEKFDITRTELKDKEQRQSSDQQQKEKAVNE